jgi:beta-lactamase regulating signal transducer with metallopeptidase domain
MGEIFLKLLNMSITASWIILAVLGIRLLFRRIPKWISCLLWGIVAIRLIFPFSIESTFSLQPSAEPIKSSTMVEGERIPYVPFIDSNVDVVENTINPALAETFAYQETQSVAPLQIVTEIAGGLWLCGMVVLLILALVSMIKLRLCVREAVLYRENIYICDAVKSPFILGIIRPRIYLSSSLSEEEMAYIIAHESAHLKRKDHLWKPFGYLLLCIYWFNPLCWVAYIMLCKDIELACDEKVIRDMNFEDKKKYSRVLLSCATQRRLVMMCPLAFGEVGVKDRVKLVLNYKKPSFWIVLISMAACVVVAVCFLTEPKSDFSIADYKAISYREYQKLTGYDAEFYHALYYIGELPKTELSIVFEGDYDEDLAGAVLAEDAKAIRIQGRLSELFGDDTKQLSESELLKKISENYGNVISIDYREGAGTAYYVGDYYAHIAVAADTDDNRNTVFEIAVENQTKNEKIFSGSSSFWLIWEEEEPVKENENVENAKDDNGYIWLSDTVFISELKDLDGNGTKEYVEVDLGDESNNFYSHFKFYWNGEMIYEYEDPCRIDPCVAEYVDLDHDGEKEIFFSFAPRVNSMPLEEYIVLKQYNSSWKPLEMIHGETMMDNAFPLSVTKGDTKWQAVISCENLDESVTFDVESHYLDLKREFLSDNGEETEFTSQLVEWYETEFVDYPSGEICGNVSAWGIWNIEVGEYEGKTCLIATHGIQCYDKFDFGERQMSTLIMMKKEIQDF